MNLLGLYWKQAACTLKENKLLSFISIAGTGLAIGMIMVIVLTYQMRVKNYAPENNRDRTLYVCWGGRLCNGQEYGSAFLSLRTLKECSDRMDNSPLCFAGGTGCPANKAVRIDPAESLHYE